MNPQTIRDLCDDRHVLVVLAVFVEQRRSLTVNDLTKTIVRHDHRVPVTEAPADAHVEIQHSLDRVHLPLLEDAGLVEYDRERRLVEPTDRFDGVRSHLSAVVDADPHLEPPVDL